MIGSTTQSDTAKTKNTIRTLAWASFFNDIGSNMIHPVWPLFLTSVLGVNMTILGTIDGLGNVFVSLSQAASGYLSDRIKRRKIFISIGYALPLIARIGYAASTGWYHVLPLRILDRSGKIRGAPRDSIIADLSTIENRGRNFGFRKTMDHLGAVTGILLCLILIKHIGYRSIFLIAALPASIATGLIIYFVREKPSPPMPKGISFTLSQVDTNFFRFLVASSVLSLGSFSYSFLILYAKNCGFKIVTLPMLFLLYSVTASLVSLPFGRLSDSIGRKPVLAISFILWSMVSITAVKVQSSWTIIAIFVLYGLHKGSLETVQKTFVSELCPKNLRATFIGSFDMVTGIFALPASVIAGLLWQYSGMKAPFVLSLALTAISLFLLILVKSPHVEEYRSG